jgi:predicted GH43/DUF377 family glycosyl hydrolase
MWQKLGRVYNADRKIPWRLSHAFLPTPFLLREDIVRVFVAFLDEAQIGRIGYVDVDVRDPTQVLAVSDAPALDVGDPGAFDDHGVTPMCAIERGQELHLYYTGWQLSTTVRYTLFAGLAVSADRGQTFRRLSRVPVLERSDAELTIRTAPSVMHHRGQWKMWYIAGSDTIVVNGKQVPRYNMRYLESNDGVHWGSEGRVVMSPADEDEYGFGRPDVRETADGFEMWYSIRTRSKGYRLGYARSPDGLSWQRLDHLVGIEPSETGWDSTMQAFSACVDTRAGRYLFYNGNNYGETGFGVAKWLG